VAQTSCEVDTDRTGEEEQRWIKRIGDEMAQNKLTESHWVG